MDLIRELLLKASKELPEQTVNDVTWKEWLQIGEKYFDDPEMAVRYHLKLIQDAGYMEECHPPDTPQTRSPAALTWKGHEFVEAAQTPQIWNEAKKRVAEAGGGLVAELIHALLVSIIRRKLGLE